MASVVGIDTVGRLVAQTPTEPFQTLSPEITNDQLIPSDLKLAYSRLWGLAYPAGEIRSYILDDVVVDGPGLVYDRNLRLVRETINQASPEEIDGFTWGVGEGLRLGTIPTHSGVTVLCEKSGIGNYGHWLAEMLPRAYLATHQLESGDWQLRLPLAGGTMNSIMEQSVELLGIPRSSVKFRRPGPERYEHLVVTTGIASHGYRYSPIIVQMLEEMAERVSPIRSGKVWVTRLPTSRRLKMETDVCSALANRGWKIIDPSQMSLEEQIGQFRGAEAIAGVTGAGITNLAFANRGIPITLFMPAPMPDVFYWSLAGFKEQKFREVRCPLVPGTEGGNWDGLLEITVDEVIKILS